MKRIVNADYIKTYDEKTVETKKPLEDVVNAFIARYANQGFGIQSEKDKNGTCIVVMRKKGMFKRVPGLHTFIYIKLSEGTAQGEGEIQAEERTQTEGRIQAEAGVLFETDSGIQTSLLIQKLVRSSICVDPAPVPVLPRYDKMLFSLTHKAVIERNIGIAVRMALCEEIFKNLEECASIKEEGQEAMA